MKQKVVIKVDLNDKKSCSKAIKTSFSIDGVVQAGLQKEKNQIEVTGEKMDVILLMNRLRKSLGHAELVSVAAVEAKKTGGSDVAIVSNGVPLVPVPHYYPVPAYAQSYHNDSHPPPCSIL